MDYYPSTINLQSSDHLWLDWGFWGNAAPWPKMLVEGFLCQWPAIILNRSD